MSRTADRGPGAQRPRSAFRVAAVVAIAIALLGVPLVMPATASGGIARRGTIDRHPGGSGMGASGNILVDGPARRGYQISREPDQSALYVYDLDSLRMIRRASFPAIEPAFTLAGPTEWLLGFDSVGKRIFGLERVAGPPFRDDFQLMTLDLKTFAVKRSTRLWPASERVPVAMSYHQPSDRIYLMSRILVAGPNGRSIFFAEERRTDGSLAWEKPLPQCFAATDYQYAPTITRSVLDPSKIYLNCYASGAVQGLIIRITLGPGGAPASDEVFAAVPGALSTTFDTGSDRMIFLTTVSGAGRGAWVFDGKRSSFLGVIATGDERPGAIAYAMGLDRVSGRLYLQTAAGILVADVRRTPLGSGLLFRKFAQQGVGAIEVDPIGHRFFVPEFRVEGQPERYLVYSDQIALLRVANAAQPDELTSQLEERSGVTGVNYSGGGRAFAARLLLTGGVQKAAWNAALGPFSTEDTGIDRAWQAIQSAPLGRTNRDVWAGRVTGVALTNDSADASAVASDADPGTKRELAERQLTWPSAAAECDDAGSNDGDRAEQPGVGVTCDVEAASVFASAGVVQWTAPSSEITARSLFSMSGVQRDPSRGIVGRSFATVGQISIMDTVWIGSVTATAEAWARGRTGKAGAILDRVLTDVRIDTNKDGKPEYQCGQCSLEETQDRINAALGGQAAVEFPDPDPAYYPNGSPGGYQAVVQKERFREYAERALNDDDTLEVPGMQLVVYSDGRAGRSRYVLQFAGVQAEAHYGIYRLPEDVQPPPPPRITPVVPRSQPALLPTVAPEPVKQPAPRTVVERIAHRVAAGLAVALARPADAGLIAVLLSFFALPGYLLWRRRLVRRAS